MNNSELTMEQAGNAIAIIGMAGRFPGANDLGAFWEILSEGKECITEFSDEELLRAGVDPSLLKQASFVRSGFVLDNVDAFDADFFGMTPREAEVADPQQRLFLEVACEALERAGYAGDEDGRATGVYASTTLSSYFFNIYSQRHQLDGVDPAQIGIGNAPDFLATLTSYKLNLRGPSYSVQTACSSSLVAVHAACEALHGGECDMALAGGVSIKVPQVRGYAYQDGDILSRDGRCRAFDAQASGTNFSNGVGVVILKRLQDALRDGDSIHALVIGSAVNNDGAQKAGFTAPSVEGQTHVVLEALANAQVSPESISYIETHGTATTLGDPIEIRALTDAFRSGTSKKQFCSIGSVKTNIGHLDVAAGVAGLIKTVLALQHRKIPASINFQDANPRISFESSPFFVQKETAPWERIGSPRRAGVSSLGIGGTNAHLILEEAPTPVEASRPGRSVQLMLLSAKSPQALDAAGAELVKYFKSADERLNIADVAYTLQMGRKQFAYRRAIACSNVAEAIEGLSSEPLGRHFAEGASKKIAFMFSGQGTQYLGMCRDLFEKEQVFRSHFDRCARLLKSEFDIDLHELVFKHDKAERNSEKPGLNDTAMTQPALFSIEYALAELWKSWDVIPHALIGHSLGEYVAACIAGVFSVESALRLVVHRARLMQSLPRGAMLSVGSDVAAIRPLLNEDLSIAAINSPGHCVISGPVPAIQALEQQLTERGAPCRLLNISHAFHSAMMDPAVKAYAAMVADVTLNAPRIPFLSNVTGGWIQHDEATDPAYWARHLRHCVQFGQGIRELLTSGDHVLLEIGADDTLTTLARLNMGGNATGQAVASLGSRHDARTDSLKMAQALGDLWSQGVAIDWRRYHEGEFRRRVPLPTYAFQRKRYWIDRLSDEHSCPRSAQPHKLDELDRWFYLPSWRRTLTPPAEVKRPWHEEPSNWLIFAGDNSLSELMQRCLAQQGQTVVCVRAGTQYTMHHARSISISPSSENDYRLLCLHLRESGLSPRRVLHLWNTDQPDSLQAEHGPLSKEIDRSFFGLAFLFKALGREQKREQIDIAVYTTQMMKVASDDAIVAERSMAFGPCRVASQEYPNIYCRMVDLEVNTETQDLSFVRVDQWIAEVIPNYKDDMVAYRGAHRWSRQYEPVELPAAAKMPSPLRDGGVYVILGGTGRFGGLVAKYIATQVRATIILVGESTLPEGDELRQIQENPSLNKIVAEKLQRVQAIERQGAKVRVVSVDLGIAEDMKALFDELVEIHGRVDGVIHAAGLVGEKAHQTLQELDEATCARMFHPKISGLRNLHHALRGRDTDFVWITSSLSPMLGGLGLVAYSAANLFMDAFASIASNSATPWRVINWEGWHRQPDAKSTQGHGGNLADFVMSDDEVTACLDRVSRISDLQQVVISTGDLNQRIEKWANLERQHGVQASNGALKEGAQAHVRPRLSVDYAEPRDEIEARIAELVQSVLGIKDIGIHDNFFELGGTSLAAVQLIARMRSLFQQDFPLRELFETPTVSRLADVVRGGKIHSDEDDLEALLGEIESLSEDEIRVELAKDQPSVWR